MNEAEARFAERLVEEIEPVLGVGILVEDVEISGDGPVRVHMTCLSEGRVHEIDVEAESLVAVHAELVRQAAAVRLAAAFWQIVGPT
ncbi:MAG TPA: hypothetical protein VJZ72_02530 [Candidatus Limnocylindrales bacterium]|nr:hypothetical protein [Candidatus Limnocylindrales bacterium]